MVSYKIWILIIALICSAMFLAPWMAFEKGVMISSVEKNSTEFNAGLRAGMIITEINGNPIASMEDYSSYASAPIAGLNDSVKVTIIADDSEFIFLKNGSLGITIEEIPKSKLKTGLDLSGGARALVRPTNVTNFSSADMADLIAVTSERFNVYGLKDIAIKQVTDLGGNVYMLIENA